MKFSGSLVFLMLVMLCGCSRPYVVQLSVVTGKSWREIERATELDGFGSHWEIGTYQQFLTAPKIWEKRIAPKIKDKIRDPESVRRSIQLSRLGAHDVEGVRITEMQLQMASSPGDDLSLLADLLADNIEYFTIMYWGETDAPYVRSVRKPNQQPQQQRP